MKRVIATNQAPAAIGPYSQAVEAGNLLFVSGQLGLDPATGDFVPGGVREQAEQAFRNLRAILTEAGYTLADVVKATVFLVDMNDFAVVSLSDLLTPWEIIQERAELAAKGDFVAALYNPRSHKRVGQINAVQDIFLRYRSPETPVGVVTGASRDNEAVLISTLGHFTNEDINMFSLVIIGNSKTRSVGDWMITPRGYQKREPGL